MSYEESCCDRVAIYLGVVTAWDALLTVAAGECGKMEAALRDVAVPDEKIRQKSTGNVRGLPSMNIKTITEYPVTVAVVNSDETIISDAQSALDFVMSVRHMTDCNCIALNKEAICEDFFKLSTGVAGEILQKFANYRFRFAIVGDFSKYTSKPLKDFIYESNKGNQVLFVDTDEEAVSRFSGRQPT